MVNTEHVIEASHLLNMGLAEVCVSTRIQEMTLCSAAP